MAGPQCGRDCRWDDHGSLHPFVLYTNCWTGLSIWWLHGLWCCSIRTPPRGDAVLVGLRRIEAQAQRVQQANDCSRKHAQVDAVVRPEAPRFRHQERKAYAHMSGLGTELALTGCTSEFCRGRRSEAESCLDDMAGEDCTPACRSHILQALGVLQLYLAVLHCISPDHWTLQQLQMQVINLGWWWRVS